VTGRRTVRVIRTEHRVEQQAAGTWSPLMAEAVTGDPRPLLAALRAAYPRRAFRVQTLTYTRA
jgi:hypothetical protein